MTCMTQGEHVRCACRMPDYRPRSRFLAADNSLSTPPKVKTCGWQVCDCRETGMPPAYCGVYCNPAGSCASLWGFVLRNPALAARSNEWLE